MKTIKKPFAVLATKCLAIPLFAILFIPKFSYADDTALVQGLITNGTAFPAGKTYTVSSSLIVNKSVNFNGDIINYTGTAGGCLLIKTAGVVVQNGLILGTFSPTATFTAGTGPSGIVIYADNVTVTKMNIKNITNYGIVVSGARVKPIITYNNIINTGYIGFYYDSEAATAGGSFSNNVVNRSLIPAATVHQPAVAIRGSVQGTTNLTTGWTIANNTISMPLKPTDQSAACLEVRAGSGCTVTGNVFNQSTIGTSLVRSTGTIVSYNKMMKVALGAAEELAKEGIEAEVIDLRTIRPLDSDTIIESVKKTNRLVIVEEQWPFSSVSSEISYRVQKDAFDYLDAPIRRITSADANMHYAPNLVAAYLPDVPRTVKLVKEVMYMKK